MQTRAPIRTLQNKIFFFQSLSTYFVSTGGFFLLNIIFTVAKTFFSDTKLSKSNFWKIFGKI